MICITHLVRYIFWCANTFCLIVGLIIALISVLFMTSVQNAHLMYCIFGLLVGLLTAASALMGYKAIRPPTAAMMWMYCALLAIVFVTQISIATQFQAKNLITDAAEHIELLWEKEVVSQGPMAKIESRFHCCGLSNFTDYTAVNLSLPASCFYMENDAWLYFSDGCLEKVKFAASRAYFALSIAGYVLTASQLLALTFSFVLTLIFHRTGEYELF